MKDDPTLPIPLLTAAQVAKVLAVNQRTVSDLLARGGLKGVRVGRVWRIARADLDTFLTGERTDCEP